MKRDFTYIDDIVAGVLAALDHPPAADDGLHRVYNLGNHRPVNLLDYIAVIVPKKAVLDLHRCSPATVETYADIDASARDPVSRRPPPSKRAFPASSIGISLQCLTGARHQLRYRQPGHAARRVS